MAKFLGPRDGEGPLVEWRDEVSLFFSFSSFFCRESSRRGGEGRKTFALRWEKRGGL